MTLPLRKTFPVVFAGAFLIAAAGCASPEQSSEMRSLSVSAEESAKAAEAAAQAAKRAADAAEAAAAEAKAAAEKADRAFRAAQRK